MCEPAINANDPVQGAMIEIISAMSSLHMIPEATDPSHHPDSEFLVDRDRWAKHAHEHLQQAIVYLRKVRPEDLEIR